LARAVLRVKGGQAGRIAKDFVGFEVERTTKFDPILAAARGDGVNFRISLSLVVRRNPVLTTPRSWTLKK
jgi:hypothetical protein